MTGAKLYVGNIPEDHDKSELEALFKKYGQVIEFDVLRDFGFVHFKEESEARSAAHALDGHNHKGTCIKVEVSRSQVRQMPGMGGKGECYRCGGDGHWSKECPNGPTRGGRGRGGGRDMRNGGGGGDRFGRGRGGGAGFNRDPYYPDPYDYYVSRRAPPPHPYDRYSRFDPYERRLPAVPPRDFYDVPPRSGDDYYRRSPPPPARDPYYDYYMKRRFTDAVDRYGDGAGRYADAASRYDAPGRSGDAVGRYGLGGASGLDAVDEKPVMMRNNMQGGRPY